MAVISAADRRASGGPEQHFAVRQEVRMRSGERPLGWFGRLTDVGWSRLRGHCRANHQAGHAKECPDWSSSPIGGEHFYFYSPFK